MTRETKLEWVMIACVLGIAITVLLPMGTFTGIALLALLAGGIIALAMRLEK